MFETLNLYNMLEIIPVFAQFCTKLECLVNNDSLAEVSRLLHQKPVPAWLRHQDINYPETWDSDILLHSVSCDLWPSTVCMWYVPCSECWNICQEIMQRTLDHEPVPALACAYQSNLNPAPGLALIRCMGKSQFYFERRIFCARL